MAEVAAATVRRFVDGSTKAGVLAGCLTLTAAQVIQLLLVGDIQNFSQTVTVGYRPAGGGSAGRLRIFPAREPRGVCLWLAVATACLQRCAAGPFGSGPGAGRRGGLCAAMAGTLEQTAVLSIALAVAITASGPALAFAALAVALGSLAAAASAPGALALRRGFCGGLYGGRAGGPRWVHAVPLAVSAGVGMAAAMALPRGHCAGSFSPPAPPVRAQGLSGAARKLSGVADALSDIADTVNAVCQRQMPPKGECFDFVVEQVARTTCQSCTRRSRCWVRGYATAMDGLYHLKPVLESRGRVEVQDLPGQLSVCIHPADLCTAANHGWLAVAQPPPKPRPCADAAHRPDGAVQRTGAGAGPAGR